MRVAVTIAAAFVSAFLASVALAGSLGTRIGHDVDTGRSPEVFRSVGTDRPRAMAIKVRAYPAKRLDVFPQLLCYRDHGRKSRS
jgi:hypothetical protein